LALVDRLKCDDILLDGTMSAATCSILRAIFTDSRMTSCGLGKAAREQLFKKIIPGEGKSAAAVFSRLVKSRFARSWSKSFFLTENRTLMAIISKT